jgi:hypothetical protein
MGSGIVVTFNDLINNAVDVYNGASSSLNAKNNYWGSPSGTTSSEISGLVDYTPWLTHPVPLPPPLPPPPSTNSNELLRGTHSTAMNSASLNGLEKICRV